MKLEAPAAERRWVLGFALAVMLATSLPYLLAWSSQHADWRFTGFLIGVEDGNSYAAKMQTGAAGAWLFRTPYTAVAQRGVFAFFPYLLLGKLAPDPPDHGLLIVLFHLFRLAGGLVAILGSYEFVRLFLREKLWRRTALVVISLGGGFGWLLILLGEPGWLGSLPLDLISPETFGFLALMALPHLAMARGLLFLGMAAFLQGRAWQAGLLWLLMTVLNPQPVLLAWAVCGVYTGVLFLGGLVQGGRNGMFSQAEAGRGRRKAAGTLFGPLLPVILMPGPLVLYTVFAFQTDPFLRQWTAQNLILSPHPLHYLVAYGWLLPFSIWGARRLIRRWPVTGWLPVVWVVLLPVFVYAPYNLQRRLAEGGWVVLVILALNAFEGAADTARIPAGRRFWRMAVLLPLLLTSLLLYAGSLAAARSPGPPAFRSAEEVAAFEYLGEHASRGQVVLASFESGNALPAWAPLRVVIGHGPESANLAALQPEVTAFYVSSTPDSDRRELLERFEVRYVLWGPFERQLGDWDPHQAAYLQSVFQSGGTELFEVRR